MHFLAQRGLKRAPVPSWLQSVGGRKHGFEVKDVFSVAEFDMTAYHLEHERTATRVLHVDSDDTNNVFSVCFRTPATDSSGLPHILEHTVLCGSERFPVRDPFFNMIKRSLNTFMNAMTASDHTMYPFATRNAKDFENLMEVYLDATFFPRLELLDFLQEGHRLEAHEEGNIIRTGVVYNEMKGTLGNSSTLFYNKLFETILPGTLYTNISGGDPPCIAKLSHEELVDFHKKHYHPSNALFFTYGDLPLERHLKKLNECVLKRFDFSQEAFDVRQVLATSRVNHHNNHGVMKRVKGPPEPMMPIDEQSKVLFARVLDIDRHDAEYQHLVGRILSTLLTDGPSAPLYEALIDSQLAPDFAPGSGFDGSTMHPYFGIGVQGVPGDDETLARISKEIESTMVRIAEEGFDPRRVKAIQHQLELTMKQRQTNFGLMVMHAISSSFAHAPFSEREMIKAMNESITVNAKMDRLSEQLKLNPFFWQDLIKKDFLEGDEHGKFSLKPDFVCLVMEPDEEYVSNLANKEKGELKNLARELNQDDRCKIRETSQKLQEIQAAEQDLSCLPTLSVDDIPRLPEEVVEVDMSTSWSNNFVWVENQKTNGLVYFKTLFDTSHIPREWTPFLPVLSAILGNVETDDLTYQELSIQSTLACTGVNLNPTLANWFGGSNSSVMPSRHMFLPSVSSGDTLYREGITVSTCSLARNLEKTIDLYTSILTRSQIGKNLHHLESLLATTVNVTSSGVVNDPLGYARRWALASLGGEHAKREAILGLSQVEFLRQVAKDPDTLANTLQLMMEAIFHTDGMTMCVVAGGNEIDRSEVEAHLQSISLMRGGAKKRLDTSPPLTGNVSASGVLDKIEARDSFDSTYIPLPISVHNCVAAVSTEVTYGHEDDAAMMVLAQLASMNFIHQQVREKGGAYGGGAMHDLSGCFVLYSFYDPNSHETLRVFAEAIHWLCEGNFSQRDIDEALLSVFGSIDAPQEVGTKGTGVFLHGISNSQRFETRARFFAVTKDSLVAAARKHLGHVQLKDAFIEGAPRACVAIAGNQDTTFADTLPNWTKKNVTSHQ